MNDAPLAERVRAGEMRAIARAMRLVDDRAPESLGLLKALWPHTGRAWLLGVTGNPGAGKSTLCDCLIAAYRARGARVGVVAVDPSCPYTGGAILGDRIRMSRHATDDGVFIRSLATRGHMGGLSASARDVVRILDAGGYDVILIETVGVGQDELEVTRAAHSTVVVMAPGLGDGVQAIKAGLLECADLFAVNKADRDGADATVRDLELMISIGEESGRALAKIRGHGAYAASAAIVSNAASTALASSASAVAAFDRWAPSVLKCVATRGDGIDDLVTALERHRTWILTTEGGRARRREKLGQEIRDMLREALVDAARHDLGPLVDAAIHSVESRQVDPYSAAESLVAAFRGAPLPA